MIAYLCIIFLTIIPIITIGIFIISILNKINKLEPTEFDLETSYRKSKIKLHLKFNRKKK
ncbi:hypothetical protein D7Y06_00505 [Roseburia sp. 1XD42-69]|nr:hypothetical protein D7Y06_00505 [Roseburia sp. 1XD42-69]